MNGQQEVYGKLYKTGEFEFDLPDYKITNNKKIIGKKILVLGVGSGRDVRFLCKENQVWGVDFSAEALKVAKRFGIKTDVADLSKNLKFRKDFFDIVIAKDVFEHLDYPMNLLTEIRRVLKRGGYSVLNVPNQFYWTFRLKILFGGNLVWKTLGHDHTKLFDEWDYMHVRFFTWNGFKNFIKMGGFKISKTFWDFGTLSHYSQPEFVISYLKQKGLNNIYIDLLKFFWSVFNFIFPRKLRSSIVSLSPSLFCTSFYVWCRKK